MTKSFTPITEPVYDFLTHGGRLHIGGVGGDPLLATDEVYPCCSQGSNRSQVLYRVLVDDFKHRKVHLPHGLVSGYDPHAAYQKLTYDNWFDGYICDGAVEQDMFAKAFEMVFPGFRKSPKLGQREADGLTLNMDDYLTVALEDLERDRAFMHRWFDEHVYGSVPATGVRKVFVCFAGPGLKILLQRLREQRHLANFNHIYIMVLPYDDEASRAAQTRGSSDFHSSVARAFSHMRELYRAINYTP